jgi:hypothetical protein
LRCKLRKVGETAPAPTKLKPIAMEVQSNRSTESSKQSVQRYSEVGNDIQLRKDGKDTPRSGNLTQSI